MVEGVKGVKRIRGLGEGVEEEEGRQGKAEVGGR